MSIRYVLEHVNLGARLARLNRVRSVFQLTNNPEKTFPLTNEFISLEYQDLEMGRNLTVYHSKGICHFQHFRSIVPDACFRNVRYFIVQ